MTPPSADVVYSAQMVARRRAVRAARHARMRRILLTVVAAAGLSYGGWALVHSSLFAVDGVGVTGLERVSRAEVLAASGVKLGMNVLSVDPNAVASRIEELPYVESVSVERIYPSKLRIVVHERVPVAVLSLPAGKWVIDALGVALEPVAEYAGLPVVSSNSGDGVALGSPVRDAGLIEGLTIWRGLPQAMRTQVKSLDATSASAVTLHLPGLRIVLGTSDDLALKLRVLDTLLARASKEHRRLRAVDLRAPERPAVRYA
jgi:cell division protein FtsQ